MKDYITYVGMDVHARSIMCKGVNIITGEYFSKRFINASPAEIADWLKSQAQPLYCAYESGCTGYYLARELRKLSIDCDIIAITTLPRSVKDKMNKCDKIDAGVIRDEIASPIKKYSVIFIPSEKIEGYRSFARDVLDVSRDLRERKQKLNSFLLLHGYCWCEMTVHGKLRKRWTRNYWNWIKSINFDDNEGLKLTYQHLIDKVKNTETELKELKEKVHELCQREEIKPYIDAFLGLKGINELGAFLALFEFGDFGRFKIASKVPAWLGLTPKNNSSGELDKHGSITKYGNKYLRYILVEGLGSLNLWNGTKKQTSKINSEYSVAVNSLITNANERVHYKYKHLKKDRRKHTNVAKVAAAAELSKCLLMVGRQVQFEQEKKIKNTNM